MGHEEPALSRVGMDVKYDRRARGGGDAADAGDLDPDRSDEGRGCV
jgi:hypothetical protein